MKKAFNFRSAIVCVLVLIMCLTAFVACDKDKDGQDDLSGLGKAKDYVKQLYINNNEETAADYTVVSKVNIAGTIYNVSWTVAITTEGADADSVKVVAGESNVTIDVIDMAESEIKYVLTATITDAKGNTETVSFNRKVPKFHVATWKEYAEAKDGKLLVVDGIVTMFNSKKDGASYNNMYIQDNDGAYYAYSMDEDPKDKNIAVGMKVRLTGTKKNYNGTYELEKVLIKEVLDTNVQEVAPININELLANATSVKDKKLTNLQGSIITLTDAILVEVDDSQKYCYFTVGGIKTYIRPSASAGFLSSKEITAFMKAFKEKIGYTATITGQALVYNNAFYMQPISKDAVEYGAVANLTPAEQVKFVKDNANALSDVTYSGYSVTLPAASEVFTDVKIAWTVDNTEICKIEKGVATFTYDYATEGRKVKLTATYTHATDTTVAPLTNEYELELLIPQDATVKEFLEKDEDNKVYKLTGTIVAKQKDGKENGAFVLADETGAVFSYNGTTEELGSVVTVYAKRTSSYSVPQLGTISVSVVEGGKAYTPEVDMTIDMKDFDWTKKVTEYTGKLIKITGLTVVSGERTDRIYLSSDGTKADLNAFTLKKEFVDMAKLGEKVVVYGYCRGLNTSKKGSENFQIQLVKVEYGYSDTEKVAKAKEALTTAEIGGTEFAGNFELPATGLYNTAITWAVKGESSVLAIEGNHATVTKPQTESEQVTIVATIKSGEVTDTKEFVLTILGETPSYAVNWEGANITAVYGDDNTALAAGGEVKKGTVVKFTVVLPANKVVKSVSVNGAEDTSVAYKTTFTVTVNAATTVVVNYNDVTKVTVAQFLEKTADANTLYAITGYIGAYGGTETAEGSYVLIDATGAVFSYNKITGYVVGDYVTVYANRTDNAVTKSDKTVVAQFPQLGTKHVEKLEGGTYVEPTAVDLDVNVDGVALDASNLYLGKFYKIVGTTLKLDSKGNFFLYNSANTKLVKAFANDNLTDDIKAMDGKEVVVYAYSRGLYYENYWQVQVVRMLEVNDALKVERAAAALDLASKTFGTGEVKLQATGLYDSKITWKSDNAAIAIAADGITATIVAGTTDTSVKLTATITLNGESTTKEFNVTVTATTPEYTVKFANVTGATVDVQVDGVAIATGAKVEQGKTLTISVTVDTENYVLVAVKAGATTLEAVEGKYTHQVVGDVEITVEVKSNKGTTAEKAYTVAEVLEATKGLGSNEYTDMVYVTGIVKSCDQGSYIKNMYLVDSLDSTVSFLVYSCNFANGVTKAYAGDTVTVYGAVINYQGNTIEMSNVKSGDTTVHPFPTFVKRTAGEGSIVIGAHNNATVTVTDNQTTGTNDTEFTFTVVADSGYEIVSVKVNGEILTAVSGVYTGTIAGVTTITVETKVEGAAAPVLAGKLDFSTTAQRESQSTTQQVWKVNGVTLTNDKDKSRSDIVDSSNPVKLYASSKVTIECTGMTKIVFVANAPKYATALKDSISSLGTVTVSGNEVTLVLSSTQNSISFSCSAQVRLNSMEVYAMA